MTILQFPLSLIFIVILNIISMILFGVDKLKSIRGGWRIDEWRLLLIALLGPFGAYLGSLLFKHKTRKAKFLLVPIFMFMQLYLMLHFHLS
ncbi:hypothetical protein AC477_01665 [miscellaneous Crenarchaeota group-1 archaeon SG8-32-1]|uniref:DUF1294 domain-containing protein n=1 Tax=miscellaneous Crenarchaeota group-1 archaeon SG8-32-1 TaxID=1685124 RepID=A0A0M0BXH5_9ARCH|nr:MAG: hypothetical protein AC477_01665 [miscellaneous Crenarchaeota group-1 archaeon SG8-32-1]